MKNGHRERSKTDAKTKEPKSWAKLKKKKKIEQSSMDSRQKMETPTAGARLTQKTYTMELQFFTNKGWSPQERRLNKCACF